MNYLNLLKRMNYKIYINNIYSTRKKIIQFEDACLTISYKYNLNRSEGDMFMLNYFERTIMYNLS